MDNFASPDPLIASKARLGPLTFIKLETTDLPAIHFNLGELVQSQVHKILISLLSRLTSEQLDREIEIARLIHASLLAKIESPQIGAQVRNALNEYLACLTSWSQGACLNQFRPVLRAGQALSSKIPSGLDLALILQKERVGCQTGVYRLPDGSVALWHTEEDAEPAPGCRFDRLRLVSFPIQEDDRIVVITTFLYPDLLPGSTFSWRSDGYLQAVDTLFLKPHPKEGALLANIATWVTLRLGGKMDSASVITSLAPFWDGYALTAGWVEAGQARAQTIEFAGERTLSTALGEKAGDFLFQVNLFSARAAGLACVYEQISAERRRPFDERILRTRQALCELNLDSQPLQSLFRLLCSRSGGEYAYANIDVKAHFAGCLGPGCLEAWIGPGPALEEDLVDPKGGMKCRIALR